MAKILGISGSLRKGSFNSALLRAAAEVAPPGTEVQMGSIAGIPLYNGDEEAEHGTPDVVTKLKDQIIAADGLLLVTPEYNNSMPGVFKNAIDWATRPPKDTARVFANKPVGLIGATPGMGGTARGQSQLRQAFVFTNSYAMPQPEVLVRKAGDLFDADGRLTDEPTRQHLVKFLQAFADWIRRFAGE